MEQRGTEHRGIAARSRDALVPRLETRWFPWAVVVVLALLTPVFGSAVWLASAVQDQKTSPCYGLGWGCEPDPRTDGMIGGFFWLSVVGAAALALLVSEFSWQRVAVARSVISLVLLGVGLVAIVVTLASTIF